MTKLYPHDRWPELGLAHNATESSVYLVGEHISQAYSPQAAGPALVVVIVVHELHVRCPGLRRWTRQLGAFDMACESSERSTAIPHLK